MGADKFKKTPIKNAILVDIDILESFFYYVLEKGSIAIDGTSLTIFKTTKNCVTVSLIPQTTKEAILVFKKEGEIVNLEFNVTEKYFHLFMQKQQSNSESRRVTAKFLRENGFY